MSNDKEAGPSGVSDSDNEDSVSPRNLKSWADMFSDDEEHPIIDASFRVLKNDVEVIKLQSEVACCHFVSESSTIGHLIKLAELIPQYTNVDCTINAIRSYANYCVLNNSGQFNDNDCMNALDHYMRLRHDTLSSFLIKCIGGSFVKTDVMFKDVFGIDSKRTPDFILETKNGHIILEIAAASSPERAYKKKGHERFGYVAKYQKEIVLLRSLGFIVEYIVIVFDISDISNQDYLKDVQKVAALLDRELAKDHLFDLEYIRKEFITVTEVILNLFSKYLNPLYGTPYELAIESDILESGLFGLPMKKFEGKYKRVGVSNSIYDRVSSICPKLDYMLSKIERDEKKKRKYMLVFEQLTNTFKFIIDQRGAEASKWYINIVNQSISWICDFLRIELKGVEVKSPRADFEFMSYEQGEELSRVNQDLLYEYTSGHNRLLVLEEVEPADHSIKVRMLQTLNLSCIYEDETLEKRMINSITNHDAKVGSEEGFVNSLRKLNFKPLCNYRVGEESFLRAIHDYREQLQIKNQSNGEVAIIHHAKQPFIYPLCQISKNDYTSYKEKPEVLKHLEGVDLGPYTNMIVKVALSPGFNFGPTQGVLNHKYEECKLQLSKYHRSVLGELKEMCKTSEMKYFPKMQDLPTYEAHRKNLQELNKKLHSVATECGVENKNLGIITMSKSANSEASLNFKKEMEHFKNKHSKSCYKGVGLNFDSAHLEHVFSTLKDSLMAPCDSICPDPIYDSFVAEDSNLMKQLKSDIINKNENFYNSLRSTNLYHSAAFISRLCHTLMFHSQSSLNSSKIVVDNLGYKNVLCIIKGGKKIFSTKKSKLFRLIYPTYQTLHTLYSPNSLPSSFSIKVVSGRTFLITPWMNYHETIVADGITFLHRVMGFVMLSKIENLSFLENIDRVYLNIILAVHNRRQTETMLHNLRYISMNCMSEVSAIEEILPEMADFNYDFFQCWIRNQLSVNFLEFAKGLKLLHDTSKNSKIIDFKKIGLKNLFNRNRIDDVNTLALSIYSSYLMSKAPTTQSLEQVKNMKSIMKTHDEFISQKQTTKNCFVDFNDDFLSYANNLNENDFNMDPSYCFLLGKFMGDYLNTLEKKSKLIQRWDSTLDCCWDELSNTKGLRGEGVDDFFGNKGYYIVYKEVLNSPKCGELMDLLNSDLDIHDKEKRIKELNETYRIRVKTKPLEQVVFHVVDKVQRGGSREIYVMDKETKVHQQLIEDYTKYLCKLVPNEMISIPSNKRLQHIHAKVFEGGREFNEKYYWVLDCRKWAPKSIIEKFIVFLMGAKDSLPESFVMHSLNFFNMMLKKRVYTRPHVVEILTKSVAGNKYKNYFKLDEKRKAYYFDMPYSWIMGIFNYFSSLMHVATQLHASHIIRVTTHISYGVDNLLHMVAHSDDSAGKIMVNNKSQMLRASFIYEVLMHASNHLLSKKKCNQGKVYYEFISILYIGGSLLSLLSKFTGMFNYHPTDKGYCSDITDAYSKSTELLLNGATFEQCYIAMKIQTQLIYRFYFGKNISESYYNMPPAFFGVPDSHPLMTLICGSDSDLFRIFKTSNEEYRRLLCIIDKSMLPLTAERTGLLKSFQSVPRVSANRKLEKLKNSLTIPDNINGSWTLKNVKFKNTYLNAIQFVNKLEDKTFLAALQDETLTRRLSRSFYFRSHLTVKTAYGDMHPKELREIIFLMKKVISKNFDGLKPSIAAVLEDVSNNDLFLNKELNKTPELFDFLYCEVSKLHDYFNKIFYRQSDIVENKKTTKPVYITLQKTAEECPVDYNPQSLCSWIKEPEFRHLLPDTRGFNTAENFVKNTLASFNIDIEDLPVEQLFPILQKVKQRSKSEYFCYSNLPSDLREISTYQDVLNFLSHNTFQNKMILGISVQFGKTITAPMDHMNKSLSDDNLQYTISLCTLVNALINSADFRDDLLDVDFKIPSFLELKEGTMTLKELVERCITYWEKMKNTHAFTKSLFQITKELLKGSKVFNAEIIENTYFYSFIKRQLLVDNVWLGVGKLFISLGNLRIVLHIQNIRVIKLLTQVHDYLLDLDQICYINMVLYESQLPKLQENMQATSVEDWGTMGLCYNESGEYYIGDARGSLRHTPAILDANLSTKLSDLKSGRIKSLKGSKMIWETYSEDKKMSFQLNTLPIESQKPVSLLRGQLVDNLKNNRILSSDLDGASFLTEICAKELDLERFVNVENVVRNYHLTDTFKVMKKCHSLSLCKVVNPEITLTNYPASDGGLLNMFISYANFDHSFDFKWHRTITPEYMSLKAAQPEAFMSELSNTIKENFDNLYTTSDKEIIHKSLTNLSNEFLGDKEEQIMNLLCTWGYVGIAGALEEMSGKTSVKSFEKIRLFQRDSPYINLFNDLYPKIAFGIYASYKMGLTSSSFLKVEDLNVTMKVNFKNISYHLMSEIHTTVLEQYYNMKPELWCYNFDHHQTQLMLTCVLEDKTTATDFEQRMNNDIILRNLPVKKETQREWITVLNTTRMLFKEYHQKERMLDFHIRKDLSPDLINPYVITRDLLLTQGIKVEATRLFHYGAISNYLYDILLKNFIEEHKNITIYFKMVKVSINEILDSEEFVFNTNWFPSKVPTLEFLESDEYDELRSELQSDEIDVEYADSLLSDYEENTGESAFQKTKRNMVKVVVNGKPRNVLKYELKLIILMGSSFSSTIINQIRMLGEDLLIVTDHVPLRMLMSDKIKVFKSRNTAWHGHCIINPSNLYYIVISHDLNEIGFWSKVLESDYLKMNDLAGIRTSGFFEYRNDKGNLIDLDRLMSKDGLWDIVLADMQSEENEREKERLLLNQNRDSGHENKEEVLEKIVIEMEKEGLEEDQISKYKEVAKASISERNWSDVFVAFANMSEQDKESSVSGGIKEAIDEVIKKPKSAQHHEMIMQVPRIFGGGRSKGQSIKNNLFRERKIVAEIEAMCPGLLWKVLSGTLYISQGTHTMFKNQLRMYQSLVKGVTHHKLGKQFLINLCKLIVNDAKVVPNPEDDTEIWKSVIDVTLKLMLLDEDKEDTEEGSFINEEADIGNLKYGISGLNN